MVTLISDLNRSALSDFEENCRRLPQKSALIFLGEPYSYRRLQELSRRFSAALYGLGVRSGDRVFLYLSNCTQWVVAYLSILRMGAVAVPVSPLYTPNEITYMINDSGAETVICQDTNISYIEEVLPKTPLKRIIFTNIADLLPLWKRTVGFLFDRIPRGQVKRGEHVHSFVKLLREAGPQAPEPNINPSESLAYILYTGGTTGPPKGVPGTHAFMNRMMKDYHGVVQGFIEPGEGVLIMVNPLFHIMGKMTFLSLGLSLGNTTVLMPAPQVDATLKAIERHKVNLLAGVPTLYRMILENDRLNSYSLRSLRYCWCGGDVLPEELFHRWERKFKIPIYQNFGSTETGFVAFSPLKEPPRPGVLGFPLPSLKTRVADPDSLQPVAANCTGELLVSSDCMIRSYWNKPEETAAAFVEMEGTLYYRMRDLVQIRDDGQLAYVDRGADIIKYKGYRISCSEIEAVLQDHPGVVGACVIGVPDPKVGERIKAIVVVREGVRGLSGTDLIKSCRERLATYKVPHYIEFRDMLPKSKVGKLLRREVRDEERRRLKT
jgi:long-chain acyl-CoA synthetase